MDKPNNDTSSLAIVAATAAASDAGDASRELAHVDQQAAEAKAADLIKLSIPKLEAQLPGLSLIELRALLVAEEAEGEARKRAGAVSAIEAAIDKHPEQVAAIGAAPPAVNLEASAPADGGPVELELPDNLPADASIVPPAPAPVVEAPAAPVTDAAVQAEPAVVLLIGADATDAEVLAHLIRHGALVVMACDGRPIDDIDPIAIDPALFRRSPHGSRVTIAERIDVSGVALAAAIAIDAVWLMERVDAEPFRRCELPGVLKIAPGILSAFPQGSLIF